MHSSLRATTVTGGGRSVNRTALVLATVLVVLASACASTSRSRTASAPAHTTPGQSSSPPPGTPLEGQCVHEWNSEPISSSEVAIPSVIDPSESPTSVEGVVSVIANKNGCAITFANLHTGAAIAFVQAVPGYGFSRAAINFVSDLAPAQTNWNAKTSPAGYVTLISANPLDESSSATATTSTTTSSAGNCGPIPASPGARGINYVQADGVDCATAAKIISDAGNASACGGSSESCAVDGYQCKEGVVDNGFDVAGTCKDRSGDKVSFNTAGSP